MSCVCHAKWLGTCFVWLLTIFGIIVHWSLEVRKKLCDVLGFFEIEVGHVRSSGQPSSCFKLTKSKMEVGRFEIQVGLDKGDRP